MNFVLNVQVMQNQERPEGGKGASDYVTGVLGKVHLHRLPYMEDAAVPIIMYKHNT